MAESRGYTDAVLRLVECWLPLAEDVNRVYGWHDEPAQLESLVMTALPSLMQASSLLEAHLVLWRCRQQKPGSVPA